MPIGVFAVALSCLEMCFYEQCACFVPLADDSMVETIAKAKLLMACPSWKCGGGQASEGSFLEDVNAFFIVDVVVAHFWQWRVAGGAGSKKEGGESGANDSEHPSHLGKNRAEAKTQ